MPGHAETPLDDQLAEFRGDSLTADGRKLADQPRVGAMTPDVDPEEAGESRRSQARRTETP